MKQTWLVITLFGLSLFSLACGGEFQRNSIDDGPNGSASTLSVNGSVHSAGGWRSTVNLYVDQNAPEVIVEAVQGTVNSWNNAAGREIMTYAGRKAANAQTDLYSPLNDDETVVYYDTDWTSHTGKSSGVLGTTIWENDPNDSNYITKGDIILNAEHFVLQDSTEACSVDDRCTDVADAETILVHEAGHLLGLDHTNPDIDAISVMHAKTLVGLDLHSRSPSAGDGDIIKQIYNSAAALTE